MTAVLERPAIAGTQTTARPVPRTTGGVRAWAGNHLASLSIVVGLVAVCGPIRIWNISRSPGGWNDDEGTYVSQAWAILHDHALAHYTYWYDHPFFGWLQIAGWAALTDAFARDTTAVVVGRELTSLYSIVGGILLYALCRRLKMNRVFSAFGALMLMLCPLAQTYGTMVYLDSIAVPWVLGAMLLATYTGRHLFFALAAGISLMIAGLTKETMLAFLPVIALMVAQHSPGGMRLWNVVASTVTGFITGSVYIAMAIFKGELFPGKGHVSLLGAIGWQLVGRNNSGPVFDTSTISYQWFMRWLNTDSLLLAFAVPMLFVVLITSTRWLRSRRRFTAALMSKTMWPIALAAFIHIGLMARPGYLPIPFVVILVPIAALLVAGGLDTIWRARVRPRFGTVVLKTVGITAAVAMAASFAVSWTPKTAANLSDDSMKSERLAVDWIVKNVPKTAGKQIVVDDNVWPDLILRGYPRTSVDWFYKLDVDSAVTPRYIPKGGTARDSWKSIDYIVIPLLDGSIIASRPTLQRAMNHATLVADFTISTPGSYRIYKVNHEEDK